MKIKRGNLLPNLRIRSSLFLLHLKLKTIPLNNVLIIYQIVGGMLFLIVVVGLITIDLKEDVVGVNIIQLLVLLVHGIVLLMFGEIPLHQHGIIPHGHLGLINRGLFLLVPIQLLFLQKMPLLVPLTLLVYFYHDLLNHITWIPLKNILQNMLLLILKL